MKASRIHYAWAVVAAGCLTIFAAIGIARFAYGMLLPSMGKGLALGYGRMGYISTGNFVGYLSGVALAPYLFHRFGGRKTATAGLMLIAATMAGMGQATGFAAAVALYFLTGIGSGLANVPVMVVVGRWFTRRARGRATGFMLVGNSLAIVSAGFLVPFMNARYGDEGWRVSWELLSAVVFTAAVMVWALLRDNPRDMGLGPAGLPDESSTDSNLTEAEKPVQASRGKLYHLAALYFAFGVTHVIYATFLVTSLVQERGMVEASAGRFWAIVGCFGFFSGPVFGGLSDRFGRKWGMAGLFAFQTCAYLLVSLGTGEGSLFASIALYGLAAWAAPTIIAAAVADSFPPEKAAVAFSFVTFCLAVGQIIGPSLAGTLAETTHTFTTAFLLSAGVTALAAVFSLRLKS
jgi:MFS family permease